MVETTASIYNKDHFYEYISWKSISGNVLWEIREIFRDCLESIESGRIRYWFPSKNWDEKYVNTAVKIIDEEWDKEIHRDDSYKNGPEFSNLTYLQKACLIERIKDTIERTNLIFPEKKELSIDDDRI